MMRTVNDIAELYGCEVEVTTPWGQEPPKVLFSGRMADALQAAGEFIDAFPVEPGKVTTKSRFPYATVTVTVNEGDFHQR